jgi:hypothetical protein
MSSKIEQLVGGYLFVEGLASIMYSYDQREISNIGRVGRMIVGLWLAFKSSDDVQ